MASQYKAPVDEIRFALKHIAKLDEIADLKGGEEVSDDLVDAVLEEGAKLSANVWATCNEAGDQQGSTLTGHDVKTPKGYKEAYQQFAQGGWGGLAQSPEYGGQGLPWVLSMALNEMWQSANLALSLCPLLTQAAIEAIEKHGSDDLKTTYLEKLISGEWTGTMNLTEPQAGTDLAAIKTVATKDESGDFYRMRGQKIFITFGEHDFTDNIIHLVLARVDGLPEGNDGLGLFVVPKFLVNPDGSLGERNDVYPVSLEHKLGIHGSPTCVMAYGDQEGAVAYLVGEEGAGLKNMFTMMNDARIGVGLQGVGLSERACQHAKTYAQERVQGFALGQKGGERVAIVEHADVKRMLMTMTAYTQAGRAMTYYAGGMIDRAHYAVDDATKKAAAARVDLLTPLVKAWCTDLSVEIASLGVQVHGGMGFIEETGAAQFYRDARILPIYEGANGIHGLDLMFRKLLRDQGAEAKGFITEMTQFVETLNATPEAELKTAHEHMTTALADLTETTHWVLTHAGSGQDNAMDTIAAAGCLYLKQFATVVGGYFMAQSLKAVIEDQTLPTTLIVNKKTNALFYLKTLLPQVSGLKPAIMGGHDMVSDITAEMLA